MERETSNKNSGKGEIVSEALPAYKIPDKNEMPFEEGRLYAYSEYRKLDDYIDGVPVRYELIEGVLFLMASPKRRHEEINGELFRQLANFLKGKPCKVYTSHFEVRLNADGADDTVLIPDVAVVCDHSKLTDAGCSGAPDFIAEILSPSTAQHDRLVKLRLYEKYGVREYWIVDPDTEHVTVYILKDGHYNLNVYDSPAPVPVHVLEGCVIDLSEVFA